MLTTLKYTHLPLNVDVEAFAGYYTPENETTLDYNGKKVLYVTGHVVVESACHGAYCSPQNYWYATVPGYLIEWQTETSKEGLPVSTVEPVMDSGSRKEIDKIILETESVARVDFW